MSPKQPEYDPNQLALPAEDMPEQPEPAERFNPAQRRAFGSVPGLVGARLDIPPAHRLDGQAVARVEPSVIRRGLLGREDGYAVDGIVLNPEEYKTVVRNPRSFQTAVQATTTVANRGLGNEVRRQEKVTRSGQHAFEQKAGRHETYIESLVAERAMLGELLEWQRVPGFARTSQIDIVALAGQAWNLTFRGMLETLKEQHNLSPKAHIDMTNAMASKLFRGPQTERVAYWGKMLEVAIEYNRAKTLLFINRQHKIARHTGELAIQLKDLHAKHGIS